MAEPSDEKIATQPTKLGLLMRVMDLLPNPVYIKDRNHIWVEVNQAFCDFLGYSRDELIGKSDFDINPVEQAKGLWEKDNLVFSTKSENINIEETTNSAGETRWVKSRKTYFESEAGREFIIGVLTDISAEKEREEKLIEAEKKAIYNVKARASFLANMGHDIKTPMNGVVGMTQVLQNTSLSDHQREVVETLSRASDALMRIIEDIMDFSRVDAGLMRLNRQAFKLSDIVENLCTTLGMEARDKGLDLIVTIDPSLPESVIGDADRLQQILMNLIENAIKFTDEGFVSISIGGHAIGQASQLTFTVKDTGVGIPIDKLRFIFDQFEHHDETTERLNGVSGLGLSLCKKLSILMGGALDATSVEGMGSEFRLSLTLPVDKESNYNQPLDSLLQVEQRHKILIVDDIQTNYDTLSILLDTMGLTADYADSARSAAHKLAHAVQSGYPYTLMLVDYCMPGTDGLFLTGSLRRNPHFADLNIIAVSAVNDSEIKQSFLSHGVIDYIVKPVRLHQLEASLKKVPARLTRQVA